MVPPIVIQRPHLLAAATSVIALTALGAAASTIDPALAGHTPPHATLTGSLDDGLEILDKENRVFGDRCLAWAALLLCQPKDPAVLGFVCDIIRTDPHYVQFLGHVLLPVVADLPAGGKRMIQDADGYAVTIVSGVVTYRAGVPTGALPGRLVRGGAYAG